MSTYQFPNLGSFLSNVASAKLGDVEAFTRLAPFQAAASGVNEQYPSEGGHLIPDTLTTALWERATNSGALLGRCERQPVTKGNVLKLPAIDERSRADGSRYGGLQMLWADEAATVSATKPKFREVELRLNKIMGIQYSTNELYEDAPALEAFVTRAFGDEASFMLDDDIINGGGSAGHMLGLLNSSALIVVAKDAGQAANTISATNVVNMWSRMSVPSRRNAVWLVGAQAEPLLFGLSSNLVMLFSWGDDGTPRLMGRPVISMEQSPLLSSQGDLILVDPTQYLIGEKSPQMLSSIHVRFLNDEAAFRFTWRVAGSPAWVSAVTPKIGTATVSPFITLQAR